MDSDSMLIVAITVLIVLLIGEPDLLDVIIANIANCK
jgi:hypothetical protein